MLTYFFDNTKPKGILFCVFYSLFFICLYKFFLFNTDSFLLGVLEVLLITLLLVGNLWFLNLIKNQNKYTKLQNYVFLFFVSFLNFFPKIYQYTSVLFVSFVLFVVFFLLSKVESGARQKKNIFDASLLILLATIFYDWTLLYIVLIWLVISINMIEPFRNGLIPLVAFGVVSVFLSCVILLFGEQFPSILTERFKFPLSFDFQKYSQDTFIFSVVFWLFFVFLSAAFYFLKSKIKYGFSFLMFGYTLISLVVMFVSEERSTAECIFVALPIALLLSSQFHKISKKWLQECILWVMLVSPFMVFLMYCNIL